MSTPAERPSLGPGLTLHAPLFYDFTVGLLTLGRERAFREKLLRFADLRPGESVLDVGCGTGSLAVAAKRQVGPAGTVFGVDASADMLARAESKARRTGLDVIFKKAPAQELPLPDASADAVTTTMMLHHLPRPARTQFLREVRRVLKPSGRLLMVDFTRPEGEPSLSHFHRHGAISFDAMIELCWDAGLKITDSGEIGFRGLRFVLAVAPGVESAQ